MITGLSGSGKSSLAFDTIYAEDSAAIESLSTYAPVSQLMPDVDSIEEPAISIDQKTAPAIRVDRGHGDRNL